MFEWFIQLLTQLSLNDIKNSIKINSYIFISSIHNRKFVKMKNINNNNNDDDDDDNGKNILLKLNPGLPNMEKLFEKLSKDKKGKVNLFYSGPLDKHAYAFEESSDKCGFKYMRQYL